MSEQAHPASAPPVSRRAWAELGRRLRVDPKTARMWTIMALRELSARGDLIARR
jgi:hypothetical protein